MSNKEYPAPATLSDEEWGRLEVDLAKTNYVNVVQALRKAGNRPQFAIY